MKQSIRDAIEHLLARNREIWEPGFRLKRQRELAFEDGDT